MHPIVKMSVSLTHGSSALSMLVSNVLRIAMGGVKLSLFAYFHPFRLYTYTVYSLFCAYLIKNKFNFKDNVMKKLLLSVLTIFVAFTTQATELNIYASGLNAHMDGDVIKIDYMLNAPATSLNVKLYDGSTLKATIPVTGSSNLTKGSHSSVTIDVSGVPAGSYTWKLEAENSTVVASLSEVTSDTDKYRYYCPQDVVVDNNPESPYFGRIYTNNSRNGGDDGGTDFTKSQARGIFIYNADLTFANGQESATTGYNGNIGGSSTDRNALKRMAVDNNGYVYVASCYSTNKGVYRMNPANPSADFTTVLSASATVNAIGIVGNNLYTLEGMTTTSPGGAFNKYSLSSGIPVGDPTSTHEVTSAYTIVVNDCDIASDGRGGWWVSQNRWNKDGYACLIHINSAGNKDYAITDTQNSSLLTQVNNASYRGVVAVNPSGTLVAMGSDRRAVIFAVTYNPETGVPSLGDARVYQTGIIGSNIDGLAFDVADNFYVVSAASERFYAYATPKEAGTNKYETPAKTTNKIEIGIPHISAYDLDVEETETGYTFSFKSNMATTDAALVFYNASTGETIDEVSIASVSKGDNVVPVNASDLPGTIGQEMTWAVRLTGEANPSFLKIYESETTSGRAHLVVDASPESPYMGQIYYSLRTGDANGGLYVFDQNYTRSSIYKLGQAGTTGYMHPSIDETGKVWLSDWTDNAHSGIWIVDPSNLTTCSQVFQGSRQSSGLYKNGDIEVGGSSPACFVYGKGENRKLFTIQEDFTTMSNQPMAIYNIGSAYTWDAAPDALNSVTNNDGFSNSLFVVEQGYWVSKNRGRGSNTSSYPALEFYGMNGTRLYESSGNSYINGCLGAGFTIDLAHNKLYMIDASKYILEFDVSYAPETNVPTLSFVNKYYTGYGAISSMSMDFAGNLYTTATLETSVGNATEMKMVVYSPATADNTTTVPAKAALTVTKLSYKREGLSSGNWGTICLPYAVTASNRDGADFYNIVGKRVDGNDNPTSIVLEEVDGALVAGRPYIFQATASTLSAIYTGDDASASSYNGLIGSLAATSVDEGMYLLSGNQVVLCGSSCTIAANRAYINMSLVDVYGGGAAPGRLVEIPLAPQSGTGIDNLDEDGDQVLKFFENGKLYIKKNGVVYDVMGTTIR